MGILNVTPDSFSDGGKYLDHRQAVLRAHQMAREGADFIDVGGESSRPGSEPISQEEELSRVLPVIEEITQQVDIPISIDTTKAEIARRTLEAGALIVNDISALRSDENMSRMVADRDAALVLMHMQGEPRTMQVNPHYDDLIKEVYDFLEKKVEIACAAGIARDRILIDPGIGFGKRFGDNFELLRNLKKFSELGPVLVGPSRKSFIGKVLNLLPEERLHGTSAAVAVAVISGADVIRVHDVKEMIQVAEITYQCMTRSEDQGRSRRSAPTATYQD